jgi:hypothetical protein
MVGDEQAIRVPASDCGKRIDKFLSEQFSIFRRTRIKKSFDANLGFADRVLVSPKYTLVRGELIKI